MAILFTINFEEWTRGYSGVLTQLVEAIPKEKFSWLRIVMNRYNTFLQAQILSVGIINTSGTYSRSMAITETGTLDNPELSLSLEPKGENAARLGIYWKVLEFGAKPTAVPFAPIHRWASRKFGADPLSSSKIRTSIRHRGIQKHPILQRIFVLAPPDGTPTGLTRYAQGVADFEAQKMMDRLTRIMVTPIRTGPRAGKGIVFQRPAGSPGGTGGQFTFKN